MGELLGALVFGLVWVKVAKLLALVFPREERKLATTLGAILLVVLLFAVAADRGLLKDSSTLLLPVQAASLAFFLHRERKTIDKELGTPAPSEPRTQANGHSAATTVFWLAVPVSIGLFAFYFATEKSDGATPANTTSTTTQTASPYAYAATEPTATATATATATQQARTAIQPPQPGEQPPQDTPNYANPKEPSKGALLAYVYGCMATARNNPGNLMSESMLLNYCQCGGDAYRQNFLKSKTKAPETIVPTWDQIQKCAAFAKMELYQNPFAPQRPQDRVETAYSYYLSCSQQYQQTTTANQRVVFCGCIADFTLAGNAPYISERDKTRCWQAALYREQYGTHATARQFSEMQLLSPGSIFDDALGSSMDSVTLGLEAVFAAHLLKPRHGPLAHGRCVNQLG
jgi:hypothetical protein